MKIKLRYLDKYCKRKTQEEDSEDDDWFSDWLEEDQEGEKKEQGAAQNVIFTFLYQRYDRLHAYIYKENKGHRAFINDLSYNINEHSIVLPSLLEYDSLRNQQAAGGELGF
jgi:hypothetical protein